MAGDRTQTVLIQDLAISIFGEALRMKGTDIIRLADRVRSYGTSLTCFFTFVRMSYACTLADRMLFKNFLNSPRVFTEFERYLENQKDTTPLHIQRDWDVYEAYKPQYEDDEELLTNEIILMSPLFRFMLLSSIGSRLKENYREAAESQLLENPSYFLYLKESAADLPLREEVVYEK